MRNTLRSLTPSFLVKAYREIKAKKRISRNSSRTAEEVFTEIYSNNRWGGEAGEFCSGSGTHRPHISEAYVSGITDQLKKCGLEGLDFVDLGCGDFSIGQRFVPLSSKYVGVDVVASLIASHRQRFGSDSVSFERLDIAEDDLPAGDVCFIRQVFQHLSNGQIVKILAKLDRFSHVFITEHYPSDNPNIKPNVDKVHGADVRVIRNSGVFLDAAPFNLPTESLSMVLEVPGAGMGEGADQGVVRTYLYRPVSA